MQSLSWEKQFSFTCNAGIGSFPGDGRRLSGLARLFSTDEHVLGTPSSWQLARTVTRRPEHKRMSEALLAQVVCTSSEPKLSLLPAVQAQRQVYLTRGVVARFGPTAGCKACAGRGGSHSHECRARVEECLTRETQARARTEAQAPEVALQPDADILEESWHGGS